VNVRTSSGARRLLRVAEVVLWAVAAVLVGCYAYVYLDRTVYQAFQAWSFDRALEHKPAPVLGFVLDAIEGRGTASSVPVSKDSGNAFPHPAAEALTGRGVLPAGAPIGRIEIPRVGVRAMIVNGTSAACLRRAVGHIEGTPLFGSAGNVGLAGHRDTFFRGLRNISKGDRIQVRTLQGVFVYVVESTEVVSPTDVQVLDASVRPMLTLVTCFPFDYVGSAPSRFIVRASEETAQAVRPRPPPGS
jgi:sortase A